MTELMSKWGGLSPHLLAHFHAVDYDGVKLAGEPAVIAPVLEGATLSMLLNWQSPFEQMGPESKAPSLAALIQSGALLPLVQATKDYFRDVTAGSTPLLQKLGETLAKSTAKAEQFLNETRGLTGVTKINSTQIFSGMPPLKIEMTLLFRAWQDAREEVEKPVNQLMLWAVPKKLAPAGFFLGASAGEGGLVNRLLPSLAPTLISLQYGNARYPIMVIESISKPLTSARTEDGSMAECMLTMTLATLTALDRDDVQQMYPL